MTKFGLGPDKVWTLGLVHSPAGPGPIIQVQVHPYLDLDPDIWGPPGPGPDFGQSTGSSQIISQAALTARCLLLQAFFPR